MNRSQEFAQVAAADGYFVPSSEASNSASAFLAVSSLGAV